MQSDGTIEMGAFLEALDKAFGAVQGTDMVLYLQQVDDVVQVLSVQPVEGKYYSVNRVGINAFDLPYWQEDGEAARDNLAMYGPGVSS